MKKSTNKMVLLSLLAATALVFSYIAVPFPYYTFSKEATQTEGVMVSSDNSYLLLQDGKYFLVTIDASMREIPEEYAAIMIADGIKVKEK